MRKSYEHAQSEEVIRTLKEQGVEVFHTHLYKGFGMEAEKAEMEDARRAAAIAHRYGLKVDSYIQWNTLAYETFFAEEPRAKDWVQRDASGQPILLTYGFEQAWRYRPCFSNPEYLAWLKRVVRYAVEEVRPTLSTSTISISIPSRSPATAPIARVASASFSRTSIRREAARTLWLREPGLRESARVESR